MGRPSSELPGQKTEAGVLSTGSAVSLPLTPRRTPGPPQRDTAVTTVLSPGSLRPGPFGLQAQTVLSPLLNGRLKSFLNVLLCVWYRGDAVPCSTTNSATLHTASPPSSKVGRPGGLRSCVQRARCPPRGPATLGRRSINSCWEGK